jgi:hypothetical protein
MRAAFPSLAVEHQEDWADRVAATRPKPASAASPAADERAWHFPLLLLADRSAAHRGWMCGSNTQRTAAEAWEYMRVNGKLRGLHVGGWWAPLREAVWRFAGAEEGVAPVRDRARQRSGGQHQDAQHEPQVHFGAPAGEVRGLGADAPRYDPAHVANVGAENQGKLPLPQRVVVTYISRQSAGNRKLIPEDHDALVEALQALVARKNEERARFFKDANRVIGFDDDERRRVRRGAEEAAPDVEVPLEWELAVLEAEKLTHDQQIQAAARTTVCPCCCYPSRIEDVLILAFGLRRSCWVCMGTASPIWCS